MGKNIEKGAVPLFHVKKFIKFLLKRNIKFYIFLISLNIILCFFNYYTIELVKNIINKGILDKNINVLKFLTIKILIIYIIISFINFSKKNMSDNFILYELYRVRLFILKRFNKIKYTDIEKKNTPIYLTRVEEESRVIVNFLFSIIPNTISDIIYIILGIYLILKSNLKIGIILFLILSIYLLLLNNFNHLYKQKLQLYLKEKDKSYKKLSDNLDNLELLKIFNKFNFFSLKYSQQYKNFKVKNKNRLSFENKYSLIFTFLKKLYPIMIYFLGGISIINNKSTLGEITFLVMYINLITSSVENIISFNSSLQTYKTSINRLEDIYVENTEIQQIKQKNIKIESIKLKNIGFKDILKNINLTIKKDEIFFIKGENGTGKSVLLKIISGLIPFDSGEIIVNDSIIITPETYETLKNYTCYIDSKSNFFSETILENLKISNNNLDKTLLKNNLFNFFNLTDNLFNLNLSLGQLQKIRILRGLLSKRNILCLDEVFSNLDVSSQLELEKIIINMNGLKFIVTHDYQFKSNTNCKVLYL